MALQLSIRENDATRTQTSDECAVRLGSDAVCEVRFTHDAVAPLHARILREGEHHSVEALHGAALFIAGERVERATLHDGSVLQLGVAGPTVSVRILRSRRAGLREIVSDASQSMQGQRSRTLRVMGMGTQVLRRSLAYGTRWLRFAVIGLSVLVVALVGMLLYEISARRAGEARIEEALRETQGRTDSERVEEAERRSAAMAAELAAERERFAAALKELGDAFTRQNGELKRTVEEAAQRASKAEARLASLEKLSAAAKDLHQRHAGSVGILEIGVSFYSPRDKAFVRFATGPGGTPIAGGPFVLGGTGAKYVEWHSGTAFLVSGDGLIATNRHVLDPWYRDEDFGEGLLSLGLRPVREQVLFCFTGQKEPLTAVRVGTHPDLDVALARISAVPPGLHPLPLAGDQHPLRIGSELFILGFPLGLEGLFTKLEGAKLQKLAATSFADAGLLLREIAGMEGVQPTLNGGVLSNSGAEQLVYDASTTHGASGSPLFDETGVVVGVNRAITRFGGANLGVPVSALRALLMQAPEATPPAPEILAADAVEAPPVKKP